VPECSDDWKVPRQQPQHPFSTTRFNRPNCEAPISQSPPRCPSLSLDRANPRRPLCLYLARRFLRHSQKPSRHLEQQPTAWPLHATSRREHGDNIRDAAPSVVRKLPPPPPLRLHVDNAAAGPTAASIERAPGAK
jgi:hypothetical protein